jgi:MFS family permease
MPDVGYYQLLSDNKDFRKFWFANVISMLGEWFNTIALFTLILTHTGSEALLGLLFTVRMLGFAIFQPIVGLLADRWSRKRIMIATNIAQALFALSFLMVDGPEDMWWLLAMSAVMMLLHGSYLTAERAAIPNIVSEDELATANALDSATWSAALAIGAALGGLVVTEYGVDLAFIIDSITFVIAALIILPVHVPQKVSDEMKGPLFSTAFANIKAGLKRIFSESRILRIVFAKASWNIAGGGLAAVFLVLAGANLSNLEMAGGIGLFFMARGIGTGIGPILARKYLTDEKRWPSLIGILVAISGLLYLAVGFSLGGALWITVLLVIAAHAASGANWVLSTILTQKWVEDEMRGRVFSMDMLLMSITFSISTIVAGWLLENTTLTIQQGMIYFACVMIAAGLLFAAWKPNQIQRS